MLNNVDKNFIKYLISFINSNDKYIKLFSHHKQVYSLDDLFGALIIKLKTGIPYKSIQNYKINIKGGALFYFHTKLIKHNFFEHFFEYYISTYVNNMHEHLDEFFVDSTLVANKYGIDLVTYNVQLKKHKSSKVSIVIDDNSIPIDYQITNSNNHDASIFINHIDNIAQKYPNLCTDNKIFIADAAYDSMNIRNKLKTCKLGKLVCDKNKRNTKNPDILKKHKINLYEKMLLNKRSKIEHVNNVIKKNKTINVRYDKYGTKYSSFVLIALIKSAFSKIGIIENFI